MNSIGGCAGTRYGCCPNSTTPKYNPQGTNCSIKGGCEGTIYGCCSDYTTPKKDPQGSNCPIGGCAGTKFGCCPDNSTPKLNLQGSNCGPIVYNTCALTQYGCCPYSDIPKSNVSGSNCPISPDDCEQSEYGCCPNGTTYSNKTGSNCTQVNNPIGGCAGTQYGCCPNGKTAKENTYGTNCNTINDMKMKHKILILLEDLEDILVSPKFIFFILFFIIFYFIYIYLTKKDTEEVSTSNHIFIIILFILLIIQCIIVALYYMYNINVYKKLGVHMKSSNTNSSNTNSKTTNKKSKQSIPNLSPYKSSTPSVPEITTLPQVFNIPDNVYTYTDAKAICQAYGAKLANYQEMDEAYQKGADWCNYGWSDDQMILFPTQMSTYEELQKIKGHEHDCGRPGINGGYISDKTKKFGVNCYGYKPKMTKQEQKIMENTSPIPVTKEEVMFEKEVEYWQKRLKDILVSPFNYNTWSKI